PRHAAARGWQSAGQVCGEYRGNPLTLTGGGDWTVRSMIMPLHSERTTRATLLGRVRDGDDAAAWREFDGAYREMLLRFCRSRGLQHADAEDVIQLVFVKLTGGLRRFEYDPGRGRFRDYLFRCVRSALADWAKCQSRIGRAVSLEDADGPDG